MQLKTCIFRPGVKGTTFWFAVLAGGLAIIIWFLAKDASGIRNTLITIQGCPSQGRLPLVCVSFIVRAALPYFITIIAEPLLNPAQMRISGILNVL
jgi:hypothetical protein